VLLYTLGVLDQLAQTENFDTLELGLRIHSTILSLKVEFKLEQILPVQRSKADQGVYEGCTVRFITGILVFYIILSLVAMKV